MIRRLALTGLFLALAAWAVWPLGSAEEDAPEGGGSTAPLRVAVPIAMDRSAFAAPIWVEPAALAEPPIPPPPEPESPPQPPSVEFLGFTRHDGVPRALVYDQGAGRIVTVGLGDHLVGCSVTAISEDALELTGDGTFTFALKKKGER